MGESLAQAKISKQTNRECQILLVVIFSAAVLREQGEEELSDSFFCLVHSHQPKITYGGVWICSDLIQKYNNCTECDEI